MKHSKTSQIRRSAVLFTPSPYCQIAANQRRPFVGHLSQARDLASSVGINLDRHTSQSTCTKCRPQFSSEFAMCSRKAQKLLQRCNKFILYLSTKFYCVALLLQHGQQAAASMTSCMTGSGIWQFRDWAHTAVHQSPAYQISTKWGSVSINDSTHYPAVLQGELAKS